MNGHHAKFLLATTLQVQLATPGLMNWPVRLLLHAATCVHARDQAIFKISGQRPEMQPRKNTILSGDEFLLGSGRCGQIQ
jgi:hypothetical protein